MYLDNAATTAMLPSARRICETYGAERFYNPSGLYRQAIEVAKDIRLSREQLAKAVGADASCLFFTSCGSESDNTAMLFCRRPKSGRVILSAAEHAAVYQCGLQLKQWGYDVVFCPVDGCGRVLTDALTALLTPDTWLVSVMHVNNTTGAVNDIAALARAVKGYKSTILFHSDGVQAVGHVPVNLRALGVDMYAAGGHKIGAPKGVGWLYVKSGVYVAPMVLGGGQEGGRRSGTENVAGICAMAACTQEYIQAQPQLQAKGAQLRACLQDFVSRHPGCRLLSDERGAPHIVAMTMDSVRGEVLMHALEEQGIIIGIGAACSSKKGTARIPQALGLTGGEAMGMVRFSINPFDTYDWDALSVALDGAYGELRKYVRG